MGCCLCRDKNSLPHRLGENGDFSNYQITGFEETKGVRKEPNDKRSLLEILETVMEDSNSGSLENSYSSGDLIHDTNIGIISNDQTATRLCSQSNMALTFSCPIPQCTFVAKSAQDRFVHLTTNKKSGVTKGHGFEEIRAKQYLIHFRATNKSLQLINSSTQSVSEILLKKRRGLLVPKKQRPLIDFPLPNEIIEIVIAFLSASDLLALAAVGKERLQNYSLSFLESKLHVSEIPNLLWQCSSRGDLERIKQIFAYVNHQNIDMGNLRAKITESHQGFPSPFMEAARKGHAQVCEYFISQQNANIEARNDYNTASVFYYNWTALMFAVDCNQTKVIKVLLRHNPDIRAKDNCGRHATYIAACEGHLDALKMLVRKDRHVVDLRGPDGMTPLIAASSRNGRVDICKYLVQQKNANVNLKDSFGGTALTYATNPVIIEILKKNRKYQYLKSYKEETEFENMIKKHKNIRRNVEKLNC